MPIKTQVNFRPIDETEFRRLDYLVMGAAYDIQNKLGRLFDEDIYRDEMASLIRKSSDCSVESEIRLVHQNYVKTLRMDGVVANGLICEFKVVERLSVAHESQLLEYMVLCEATRGKLISFGSSSVAGKLISTTLSHDERRKFVVNDENFCFRCSRSELFYSLIIALAKDWGLFLRSSTWHDAIVYLSSRRQRACHEFDRSRWAHERNAEAKGPSLGTINRIQDFNDYQKDNKLPGKSSSVPSQLQS